MCEVRAELFYAARRTERTDTAKLTVAFSNFAIAPTNVTPLYAIAIQLQKFEGNINPSENKIRLNYT
jgi:hypothetical protein